MIAPPSPQVVRVMTKWNSNLRISVRTKSEQLHTSRFQNFQSLNETEIVSDSFLQDLSVGCFSIFHDLEVNSKLHTQATQATQATGELWRPHLISIHWSVVLSERCMNLEDWEERINAKGSGPYSPN